MHGLYIIGTTVLGAGIGFCAGAWYGEATDRGDLPLGILMSFPGALIGGAVGVAVGVVIWA